MQDAVSESPLSLNYAARDEGSTPRRPWILILFLILTFAGEAVLPRSSRWRWPMAEDYVLLALFFVGALLQSILSSLPAWIIGVYGVVGLVAFWEGQFHHWNFAANRIGSSAIGWLIAFVLSWALCRSFALLRLRQRGQIKPNRER